MYYAIPVGQSSQCKEVCWKGSVGGSNYVGVYIHTLVGLICQLPDRVWSD